MMNVGFHIIAELYGCPEEKISRVGPIRDILNRTVEQSQLTKVGQSFYQFMPSGVTGVILLSSSHISVHTWPEYKYVSLDIFSCAGEKKARRAFELIKKELLPQKVSYQEFERGGIEKADFFREKLVSLKR